MKRKRNITPELLAEIKAQIAYSQIVFGDGDRRRVYMSVTFGGVVEYGVTGDAFADTFTYATLDEAVALYNDL